MSFANERTSCETEPTLSVSPAAVPSRNSTVYGKLFMRGSKPGRRPSVALTFVAFVSVMVASLLVGSVPAVPTVPSTSGRFVSPGSSSWPCKTGVGTSAEPPSIVTGPRIWLTVFGSGGKVSASPPSTVKSGRPCTKTVWATSQSLASKTSCGVTTAPPWLSGPIANEAVKTPPPTRVIVSTRPTTLTL